MASKEELFVSIAPSTYMGNKSNILKNQADLLQSLRRLHNLKVLTRQKNDLKIRLNKLMSLAMLEIDSIQGRMPTPKIPKAIQKYEPQETKPTESFYVRNEIENELKQIQEKLRQLNN